MDSFDTGTHIYLFDLKKKSNILNKKEYELIFNAKENDILINEDYDLGEEIKKI